MRKTAKTVLFGLAAAVAGAIALGAGAAGAADVVIRFQPLDLSPVPDSSSRCSGSYRDLIAPECAGGRLSSDHAKFVSDIYDGVYGVTTCAAQDSSVIEGTDLAGVIQDFGDSRTVVEAYTSILKCLEREQNHRYDAKLPTKYAWPSRQPWCNPGDKDITKFSLDDLEGKKIRIYPTTLGASVEMAVKGLLPADGTPGREISFDERRLDEAYEARRHIESKRQMSREEWLKYLKAINEVMRLELDVSAWTTYFGMTYCMGAVPACIEQESAVGYAGVDTRVTGTEDEPCPRPIPGTGKTAVFDDHELLFKAGALQENSNRLWNGY